MWGIVWEERLGGGMGNLTALKIKNIKEPGRYSDGEGLILVMGKSGKGSWVLRVQHEGKRRDIGLGSLSTISLAEAREAASTYRKQAHSGLDPVAERKKERRVIPSFETAARQVHDEHKATWKNGKHQAQWISTLETYAFPVLGDLLVSDIEGPVIQEVLAPIWLTKPETARRVRQRITSVLDWAYAKGFRASEAPARSLSRGLPRQPKKDGHFAAMPFQDVPAFLVKVRDRLSVGRLAVELAVLTACRSGEVRGARWSEIDIKKKLWTIPAERMKAGKEHIVPLSVQALDVLDRAKLYKCQASDLVFPGQRPKIPLSDMTLLKVLRDMNLEYTVHGFRSSFRDWVAETTTVQGEVAEAALAHTVANKVEAAYRRTNYLDKRKPLMAQWGCFCDSTPLKKR